MSDGIELASVVRDLRTELKEAVTAADGEALLFELGPIELEVTVAVARSGKAGGRLKFWVVEADAGGTADSSRTQRIKLVLTPSLVTRDAAGNVRSTSAHVSGGGVPGERG